MMRHMKRDVVIVALENSDLDILMVRTHRFPDKWQPVGGGVEPHDENPLAAIVREVKEEVGISLDVSALEHIITVPFDFGEGSVYCYQYPLKDTSMIMVDKEEIAEVRWVKVGDALNLPMYPATESFIKTLAERV